MQKSESTSQFNELTSAVINLSPPINLSWLAPKLCKEKQKLQFMDSEETDTLKLSPLLTGYVAAVDRGKKGARKKEGVAFSPLQVKKTKFVPNSKKRRGKRSRKT